MRMKEIRIVNNCGYNRGEYTPRSRRIVRATERSRIKRYLGDPITILEKEKAEEIEENRQAEAFKSLMEFLVEDW